MGNENENDRLHEQDLGRLAGALDALTNQVERMNCEISNMRGTMQHNGEHIIALDIQCRHIGKQISEIKKTVIHGNGQAPLVTQVAQISMQFAAIGETIEGLNVGLKEHIGDHDRIAEGKMIGKTHLVVGIIAFIGTMIMSVAALCAATIPFFWR